MRVSLDWLKEYVPLGKIPREKLVSDLTFRSVEVEEVIDYRKLFDRIVVGEILSIKKHPSADRLQGVETDIGVKGKKQFSLQKQVLQIVCGGSNLALGQKVALALPGARVFWHGSGEQVVIKKMAIRGVESEGMICAPEELGFMKGKSGEILVLDKEAPVGQSLSQALQCEAGVLDLNILPNRGDLMGHDGVAREIAAVFSLPLRKRTYPLQKLRKSRMSLSVRYQKNQLCPRYSALVISGIDIKQSPAFLSNRLLLMGLRPINSIVDITNYLLYESGQPLHAFDYDKIAGREMYLREAKEGEQLITLDGGERRLSKGMLVISDKEQIIDLAGIMGGQNSEIGQTTNTIVLQAAVFDALCIRRTARLLRVRTEAVARYEKGVDVAKTLPVLGYAWDLIKKIHPHATIEQIIDDHMVVQKKPSIRLRISDIDDVLGMTSTKQQVTKILQALGCKVIWSASTQCRVTPPSYRLDLRIKEDLIEEIGRILGYHRLGSDLPIFQVRSFENPENLVENQVRAFFVGNNFSETIHYSFIPLSWGRRIGLSEEQQFIVENPLTEDHQMLRSELFTSLLATSMKNLRFTSCFQLFEISLVFTKGAKEPRRRSLLTAVLIGGEHTFGEIKGILEMFLFETQVFEYQFQELDEAEGSHKLWERGESQTIHARGKIIGRFGRVKKQLVEAFKINTDVFGVEVDMDMLSFAREKVITFHPLPRLPGIPLDLAIIVDLGTPWSAIEEVISRCGGKFLKRIQFFDVYHGGNIPQGKKSIAFHLEFRCEERTLTMAEIETDFQRIQEALEKEIGALVRRAAPSSSVPAA